MCRDFKTRWLAVQGQGADDVDEPDLIATSEELVSLLRWNIRQLKAQTRATKTYDPDLGRQVQALVKSANGLLDSVRKLQEQGSEVLRSMSLTEKADLVRSFLEDLPEALRDRVISDARRNARGLRPALNS